MKSWSLATWAELLEFHTIWIVATVLLGDVVTFFAVNARHSDLWADIRALAGHGDSLFLYLLHRNRGVRIPSDPIYGKKSVFFRSKKEIPRVQSCVDNPPGGSEEILASNQWRLVIPGSNWISPTDPEMWNSAANILPLFIPLCAIYFRKPPGELGEIYQINFSFALWDGLLEAIFIDLWIIHCTLGSHRSIWMYSPWAIEFNS